MQLSVIFANKSSQKINCSPNIQVENTDFNALQYQANEINYKY